MANPYDKGLRPLDGIANGAFDASAQKSDTVDLTISPLFLYIGGAGNIKVRTLNDEDVTLAVVAAQVLPLRIKRLWSTGTTATLIFGMY